MTVSRNKWLQRTPSDNANLPPGFGNSIKITRKLASLLWNRGMKTEKEIDLFLSPHLRYLEKPEKWPDIRKAALLITENLLLGKQILIWGDYDVDGVTGVSIAIEVLNYYGFSPLWHLPERAEGYGLNETYIEKFVAEGAQILLTVDCGTSDIKEVQKAIDCNMLVVISDHHLSLENLPNAHALCNPRLADCPCANLAGVGVAFFLMAEINTILSQKLQKEKFDMRNCLDLVALGTLADMVSLEGQNRILVKNGLLKINEANRLGLAALKSVSNHNVQDVLTGRQIVFGIAPRINAAGRMASAELGVELFLEKNKEKAYELAKQLDEYNEKRRKEEKLITETALLLAEEQESEPVLFVRHDSWNQGIVGIVASRLVEKFHKPSFVFSKDDNAWKASARSTPNFDLHAGLCSCSDILKSFGGHKVAAGLRVTDENYDEFTRRFTEFYYANVNKEDEGKIIKLDGELAFDDILDNTFRKELAEMQPFGIGNSEPVFSSPPLLVKGLAFFGAQKNHVRITLQDTKSGITLTVKVWSQSDKYPREMQGKYILIAYSANLENTDMGFNDFIKIKDWQYSEIPLQP